MAILRIRLLQRGRFKGIEGPFQVAGSYAWASLDALQLKVHYVNWISALGLTLCFEDNKLLLTVTENYSSGEGVDFRRYISTLK